MRLEVLGLFCSAFSWSARSASLSSSLPFAAGRFFLDGLDEIRRLHVLLDLLVLRHHLAVLRRGSQFPVDDVRRALRVDEDALPQAVLFFEALLHRLEAALFHDRLQRLLQLDNLLRRVAALAFEVGALGKIEPRQHFGKIFSSRMRLFTLSTKPM